MQQSSAALATVLIICAVIISAIPLTAAGPNIVSPVDGQTIRGKIVVKAEKKHIDGNSQGYISYEIAGRNIEAPDPTATVAVIHPFKYTWNTQKPYINRNDPWHPYNGSRQFPDGDYDITAYAFSQSGEQIGEAATITVTVANRIPDVPRNSSGRILLLPGGKRGQQIRYSAKGELYAYVPEDELWRSDWFGERGGGVRAGVASRGGGGGPGPTEAARGTEAPGDGMPMRGAGGEPQPQPTDMTDRGRGPQLGGAGTAGQQQTQQPPPPPLATIKMRADWREVYRKAFGPGHTPNGKRWHGQRDEKIVRDAERGGRFPSWRDVAYAVVDEYPDSGWVELVGRALPQLGENWEQRPGPYNLAIRDLDPGTEGEVGGASLSDVIGGRAAAARGRAGAEQARRSGASRQRDQGMRRQPQPGGPQRGAGQMEGQYPGQPQGGGAGNRGGGGAGTTLSTRVNLAGLGEKYRSTIQPDGSVSKLEARDPRWPLAELWTTLPRHPVKEGDTWSGPMTILPFFDQPYHLRVNSRGGTTTGPHHDKPLDHFIQREHMREEDEGGRNGPITHTLDGFEYYKGYECARIVTKFRNYSDRDAWRPNVRSGWELRELSPPIMQALVGRSGIAQFNLTRITYFAYRSGHIVGIEDRYYHRITIDGGPPPGRLLRHPLAPDYQELHFPQAGAPEAAGQPRRRTPRRTTGQPGQRAAQASGIPPYDPAPASNWGIDRRRMANPAPPAPQSDATTRGARLTEVTAEMTLKITEKMGSDQLHPREEPAYAIIPPTSKQTNAPTSKKKTPQKRTSRYIVVEDEGKFYPPSSEELQGKQGVVVDATAKQLMELGYQPDPALNIDTATQSEQ